MKKIIFLFLFTYSFVTHLQAASSHISGLENNLEISYGRINVRARGSVSSLLQGEHLIELPLESVSKFVSNFSDLPSETLVINILLPGITKYRPLQTEVFSTSNAITLDELNTALLTGEVAEVDISEYNSSYGIGGLV